MGAHPTYLPGGAEVTSAADRAVFAEAWLPRWAEQATTSNGFLPVRDLPNTPGKNRDELIAAINDGTVKAMLVDGSIAGKDNLIDPELGAALAKLEFLAVIDSFGSPLVELADIVLPKAVALEKDGSFTSFDRTVQRVRATVPAMGESRPVYEAISMLAQRMGYALPLMPASQIMSEIGKLVRSYGGVTFARLERAGVNVPTYQFNDPGSPILGTADETQPTLSLTFVGAAD